jgi:hypothetical protein
MMRKTELFELLHLARSRYSNARATVRVRRSGWDLWGWRPEAGTTEESLEVRLERPEDADAVFRQHIESPNGHWQQCAFDPNVIIPELWLEPLEEVTVAGRSGVRVRGSRRGTSHDYMVLPTQSDEWELVVDLERGILLRLAAVKDGVESHVFQIMEIVFNEPA